MTAALRDAWDEARALVAPPIRRDAARAALLRVLALATSSRSEDAREVRRDAETLLLVVESGGSAAARKRGAAQWHVFARRRLRSGESVQDLAQIMHAVGIDDVASLPSQLARKLRDAWAHERLVALAERGARRVERWSTARVPKDAAQAYRFACESLRRKKWTHAAACARVAEQQHKTAGTRENARLILLTALHRAGRGDAALVRDTIASFVAAAQRGRKVWMFDWRTLAALAIAHDINDRDDAALLQSLAHAWREADPTFAATPLLGVCTRRTCGARMGRRRGLPH